MAMEPYCDYCFCCSLSVEDAHTEPQGLIATGTLNESAPDMNVALNLADTYPLSRPQRIARIRSIPLVASPAYDAAYEMLLNIGASSTNMPNMIVMEYRSGLLYMRGYSPMIVRRSGSYESLINTPSTANIAMYSHGLRSTWWHSDLNAPDLFLLCVIADIHPSLRLYTFPWPTIGHNYSR